MSRLSGGAHSPRRALPCRDERPTTSPAAAAAATRHRHCSLRGPLLFLVMSITSTFAFALNLLLFPLFKAWDPMLRHGH